jgi:hypothetical protein
MEIEVDEVRRINAARIADCGLWIAAKIRAPQSVVRNQRAGNPQSAIRNPQSEGPQSAIRNR